MAKTPAAYFLLVLLTAILASCDQQPKHYRIGMSQCSDDDWRNKMNAEITRELMFHPEAEIEIRSADDSNEKQIADIQYFIDNDFDAIIAAPNEARALTPIISEAYNKGIPVLLFDRNVEGSDYTAWQGADNYGIGRMAALHAIKAVGSGAPVIEIRGLKGSTPAEGRHDGFHSVEGINCVAEGYGNWNYNDAARVVDSLLDIRPDAKIIYAHNDRMAIAASDVSRRRGLSPYIIGVDAAPEIGMKAVADSVINATFLYPTEGQRIVRTAIAMLEGEHFDSVSVLPATAAVTASNVGILLLQNEAMMEETVRLEQLKKEVDDYWTQHSSQTSLLYLVIIIVLLLSGVLFLLLRTFWQHRRHQAQLNEATASKLAFFTNVSHDLRTPLTLISDPVEQLSKADNLTDRQRSMIKIADRNVKILRRLINQILDFRKYENGKLELHLSQVDFKKLVESWAEAFAPLASKRKIDFTLTSAPAATYLLAVDVEKIERVFYNIVANAFKFTPEGGRISVDLSCDGKSLEISISDTGKGISAEDLPLIFDTFFQVDRVNPNGSGIGLVLAKAFVELHGGRIQVESTLGKGTKFTVSLPVKSVENSHIPQAPPMLTAETVEAELALPALRTVGPDEMPEKDRLTVLAIDDNADILALLADLLADNYSVITATNAKDGLELARRFVPDLIICDVMMPEMDGLECCRLLKTDVATSHIPVMMLTACAMDEQRVEGYEVGADGYVSKPFSSAVLLARVRNLIANRRLIRNLWQNTAAPVDAKPQDNQSVSEAPVEKEETPASVGMVPDIDNDFYKKFLSLVNEQMGNPELNVEELASAMGLGRSQFYRKIKSLTNHSPVELLRLLRLERARHLLASSDLTISEISYEVGFSTPAYFTKCYREAYGLTPSEFREKL